jgi:hypothetical protein
MQVARRVQHETFVRSYPDALHVIVLS